MKILETAGHSRKSRRPARALAAVAIVLAAGALGFSEDDPVPWPGGRAPTDAELDDLVQTEIAIADHERFEEYLNASEAGEANEEIYALQEDIDVGFVYAPGLPGESLPARIFRVGDSAFAHQFERVNGYGHTEFPRLKRVHQGHYGGLDTFSCAGCHQQGGVNGAGTPTASTFYFGDGDKASSAVVRNPPNALGLGLEQQLGVEMTQDLQLQRDTAKADADKSGKPVTVALTSHGVGFGKITVSPGGAVNTAELEGVDKDLVIKPFGWKGHTARLRRFVERAARIHFGVQSHVLALGYKDKPDPDLGPGPNWWDPDNDGVQRELEEGTLSALALYLEQLETPVMLPPHDTELQERWAYGAALFSSIGCAGCHKPSLPLMSDIWYERPDTTGGPGVQLHLLADGQQPRGTASVGLFSDLKRHHMGAALTDPNDDPDGIGRDVFMTRPLWGLAETAPYLHDGRATTIPEAVHEHGGEAQGPRDLFLGLSDEDRQNVELFLLSLSRTPNVRVPQ